MGRLSHFLRRHLNSWNEICMDEKARLRTNTIIFIFAVACFFVVMVAVDALTGNLQMLFAASVLLAVSLGLFLLQFFTKRYLLVVSWIFGCMALAMSAYFLFFGGLGGYSFIWIFLVPHIAVMVIPVRQSFVFNGILLALSVFILNAPLDEMGRYGGYNIYFRYLFPLGLVFVCLCIYIAELVRYKIQRQLKVTADELESFAFTDPLTGVYNRRALTAQLGGLDEDAYGLSFAILDLDFFKKVNDRYGHGVGDRMLKHIVSLVRAAIPPGALLYRWGGEEFLLVIKTSQVGNVRDTLEGICRLVERTPLQEDETAIPITVSIGGMCASRGASVGRCIAGADEKLYMAKTGGRNQVVL